MDQVWHYVLVIAFVCIVGFVFHQIIVKDEDRRRDSIRRDILSGQTRYVWLGGVMGRIHSIIDQDAEIVTISLMYPDGDSHPFYARTSDIRSTVSQKQLTLCGIFDPDYNPEPAQYQQPDQS